MSTTTSSAASVVCARSETHPSRVVCSGTGSPVRAPHAATMAIPRAKSGLLPFTRGAWPIGPSARREFVWLSTITAIPARTPPLLDFGVASPRIRRLSTAFEMHRVASREARGTGSAAIRWRGRARFACGAQSRFTPKGDPMLRMRYYQWASRMQAERAKLAAEGASAVPRASDSVSGFGKYRRRSSATARSRRTRPSRAPRLRSPPSRLLLAGRRRDCLKRQTVDARGAGAIAQGSAPSDLASRPKSRLSAVERRLRQGLGAPKAPPRRARDKGEAPWSTTSKRRARTQGARRNRLLDCGAPRSSGGRSPKRTGLTRRRCTSST